jgi:Cytochrome P450
MSHYTMTVLAATVVALLWRLYRAALPKPIPGIPYLHASAQHILGDVPDALKHYTRTSELISFLVQRCEELHSPVVQVFMRPFRRPWVVLLDGREAQDIMARRSREFDRADFFREILHVTFPHNQVHMRTNDQWRFNRRLAGDAMSPHFLHQVAAPRVHDSTLDLIEVWQQKLRLSKGHTIDVIEDIRMCTVDTIWAPTFGVNIGTCRSQSQHLRQRQGIALPESEDTLLQLPTVAPPAPYLALKRVAGSSEIPMNSPFGQSHHVSTFLGF